MTVGELKKRLKDVPDDVNVVFQGSEPDEDEDGDETDSAFNGIETQTTCTGNLLFAYSRANHTAAKPFVEFVLDCSILDSENLPRV